MRLMVLLAASLPLTLGGPALAQDGPPPPPAPAPADAGPLAGAPATAGPPPPPPILADVPPPPPPPPVVEVYVMVGQKQRGPLEPDELAELVRAGDLRATTFVWMQGMGQWAQAADVPAVAEVLAAVEAPPLPLAYYVAVRGRTTGPFGRAVLAAQVTAGTLTADTLVFANGMDAWAPASTRDDLVALLSPAGVTPAAGDEPGADTPGVGDDTPADQPAVEEPPVEEPVVEEPVVEEPVVEEPVVEEPGAVRGPVAELVGRWRAKRSIDLAGVGPVEVDLTITRAADGTATLEGRGKGSEDPTVTLVLRADAMEWSATEPENGRTSLSNKGDIEVMVRRAGQPTERSVVPEDVATEFEVVDADTIRDTGDGTTWTRR